MQSLPSIACSEDEGYECSEDEGYERSEAEGYERSEHSGAWPNTAEDGRRRALSSAVWESEKRWVGDKRCVFRF